MQQMSSAQIVSASAMHTKSALTLPPGVPYPAVTHGSSFWQPALGAAGVGAAAAAAAGQDVKPFGQTPFGLGSAVTTMGNGSISSPVAADKAITTTSSSSVASAMAAVAHQLSPSWQGRAIATSKLRLLEFSAYVEQQRDADSFNKHLFVHIGSPVSYSDPILEPIDVRQIQDKFPEKKGGLKELFEKGPQDAFFLVKFWADLNTNISDEAGSFYGVSTTYATLFLAIFAQQIADES